MIRDALVLFRRLIGILFIAPANRLFAYRRKASDFKDRLYENYTLHLILLLLAISAFIFFLLLLLV